MPNSLDINKEQISVELNIYEHEDNFLPRIHYIRQAKMVITDLRGHPRFKADKYYVAVVRFKDNKANEAVRRCEDPEHKKLEPKNEKEAGIQLIEPLKKCLEENIKNLLNIKQKNTTGDRIKNLNISLYKDLPDDGINNVTEDIDEAQKHKKRNINTKIDNKEIYDGKPDNSIIDKIIITNGKKRRGKRPGPGNKAPIGKTGLVRGIHFEARTFETKNDPATNTRSYKTYIHPLKTMKKEGKLFPRIITEDNQYISIGNITNYHCTSMDILHSYSINNISEFQLNKSIHQTTKSIEIDFSIISKSKVTVTVIGD